MNVLLIGGGGREHALAEVLLASPTLGRLQVAPGNPGMADHRIDLDVADHGAVVARALRDGVDLVVVGPEAPLVDGLADALRDAGLAVLGPSAAAARLEGSKAFTRRIASEAGVPQPASATFVDTQSASAWLDEFARPVVVKADGLAAGKGVIIPETRAETDAAIAEMLDGGSMGDAGRTVVLEERMTGPELSLFALCDGTRAVSLGVARDHKRVGDGDTGPNTGGMGAFSPVPGVTEVDEQHYLATFVDPVLKVMAERGTPYVGVLYVGLMLTDEGPKLVEFNCRLGDPEAQVVLPLLADDAVALFAAVAAGRAPTSVGRRPGHAATVVACAEGYPAAPRKGVPIPTVPEATDELRVFHAGTAVHGDRLVSAGGRVLAVTGLAEDLDGALERAYAVIDELTGDGLFARSDIGGRMTTETTTGNETDGAGEPDAYARAGVSFEAGESAVERIAARVGATHDDRVVAGVGSFGGVYDVSSLGLDQPLLVSSTDTCGTKTVLAAQVGHWDGIGADIVNHGVNDVLVQGARPLFMLDTISAGSLSVDVVDAVVGSMATACVENGCVLLGGETAEVPGLIHTGQVDVAGTMVGVVDRSALLPRADIRAGDVLLGLESNGLHTNGYSLARTVVAELGADHAIDGDDLPLGLALLRPHRSYLAPLAAALDGGKVKALAHLTGGGFPDNIPRCLPDGLGAEVDTTAWPTPPLFQLLVDHIGLGRDEAHRVFNMGIGMVVVVAPGDVDAVTAAIDEPVHVIGSVTSEVGVTLR